MKEVLTHIQNFLASQSLPVILQEIQNGGITAIAKNTYTWLLAGTLCIYLLWTKKFKLIIALASIYPLAMLTQKTLAESGDKLDLNTVLIFISGTAVIIGVNVYLLFIRD